MREVCRDVQTEPTLLPIFCFTCVMCRVISHYSLGKERSNAIKISKTHRQANKKNKRKMTKKQKRKRKYVRKQAKMGSQRNVAYSKKTNKKKTIDISITQMMVGKQWVKR